MNFMIVMQSFYFMSIADDFIRAEKIKHSLNSLFVTFESGQDKSARILQQLQSTTDMFSRLVVSMDDKVSSNNDVWKAFVGYINLISI